MPIVPLFFYVTQALTRYNAKTSSPLTASRRRMFCIYDVAVQSEVHTEVQEQSIVVTGNGVGIPDIGNTELITKLKIQLVVLSTATQFETHVVAIDAVNAFILQGNILHFLIGAHCVCKIRSDKGQQSNLIGCLETIFHNEGDFKVVMCNFIITVLCTTLCVIKT